ncbi:MAG: hypothetical protein QUS14_10380 [Pyrinomonadaceae bacterium]|nr:hypothetical protein [Pyrinomonadaceae bacterium]
MNSRSITLFSGIIIVIGGVMASSFPAFGQFPIKIPRIGTPRPASTPAPDARQGTSGPNRSSAGQEAMRREFVNEFGKYRTSVYSLMQMHDPKLHVGNTSYGPPTAKADWDKTMLELGEMDAACRSKYAGMTDDPSRISWGDLNNLPATWCTIAARRYEYAQKGRLASVNRQARNITDQISKELDIVERDSEDRISMISQLMFWDTDKWKAEMFTKLQPAFAASNATIPDDYLDTYIARAMELRKRREAAGATRSFTPPPNRDAAIEQWVRAQYQKSIPGIQILKIGSQYADWRVFTNNIGIPTSRTKRGWALVKVPNRPMCQGREWIVKQDYAGGGRYSASKVDSLGYTGILMKCE